MIDLPFTPQIRSVFKESSDLSLTLKRNGVDMDLFFHCFINDLSLSCFTILDKYSCIEPLKLASAKIISKKKETKSISSKFTPKFNKFIGYCEETQIDFFQCDYIPPEIILLNCIIAFS